MTTAIDITIPEDLAETLEVSFQAIGRNLLRELSDVLDIPFRDLVKKVYGPSGAAKIRLCAASTTTTTAAATAATTATTAATTSIPTTCKGIIQHYNGGFLCGLQTVQGSCFCSTHFGKATLFNTGLATPLRRLKGVVTEELWAAPNGIVVNKEGIIMGAIKDNVFCRYS
jgi:hypothetical protein